MTFALYFKYYSYGKVTISKFIINKEKVEKMNQKLDITNKIKNLNWKNTRKNLPSVSELKQILKKLKITLDEFHMKLELGTKDVLVTSASITFISSLLGIVLAILIKKYDEEKYAYEIMPIYDNKNIINLYLKTSVKIKIINIISAVIALAKLNISKKKVMKKEKQYLKSNKYNFSY